jgi:hypothetical protein
MKTKNEITGPDCAMIAAYRYFNLPKKERDSLLDSGVTLSDVITIMSLQIIYDNSSVTADELLHLSKLHKELETEQ